MLNVTRLLCGADGTADAREYGMAGLACKPVVLWNVSRTCNLRCLHCYTDSEDRAYPGELTTEQGRALLRDLADFGVRTVEFAGGEPLERPDVLDLAAYGSALGLEVLLCTNGTAIDRAAAERIRDAGVRSVGISIDAVGPANDRFRGVQGAFEQAVAGIRHCRAAGLSVGLRVKLTPWAADELDAIFDFIQRERLDRACFYHLVPSGRSRNATGLSRARTRAAVDTIFRRAQGFFALGVPCEIFTADNHTDAVYLYRKVERETPERAAGVLASLAWSGVGANATGSGLANVDAQGNVHPDEFMLGVSLGNVKERRFGTMWCENADPTLAALRALPNGLRGRCAGCRYAGICGGNFRARALNATGDLWGSDPACYLSDDEVATSP